ncbi:hypothetical protein BAE44_0013564 [Dichanthelium oligosanthes]|uniref:Uncharacterized protein n=1 Tax=Dichanthelium oligosanthes TaxID=888268 RepID=A0A1E5VJX3_9POAL|nr:hypothetical protein BAE44_0013564 [Dichanthelium oligosanthes]
MPFAFPAYSIPLPGTRIDAVDLPASVRGEGSANLKMSCQKLSRQSLYMVLRGGDLYLLSSMDVSRLFYSSKAEAVAAHAKAKEEKNGSNIHYGSFRSAMSSPNVFALFGKSNILCSDPSGYTSIYRAELHSFLSMPRLTSPKGSKRIVVSMPRTAAHAGSDFVIRSDMDLYFFTANSEGEHTDSLYIMDMDPDNLCMFEVLATTVLPQQRLALTPTPAATILGQS